MQSLFQELLSILDSIGQEQNVLLLKAGIHQKLAVLYLKGGDEDASMQHNIAASEAFDFLGQAKAVIASEYLPVFQFWKRRHGQIQNTLEELKNADRFVRAMYLLEYVVDKTGRVVNLMVEPSRSNQNKPPEPSTRCRPL